MRKLKIKLSISFMPSTRLAVYIGAGALLWLVAMAWRDFEVVALMYDLVLALVAILDVLLSAQPHEFTLLREVDARMNLGAPNPVLLHAQSRLARAIQLTLRDEPPLAWPVAVGEDAEVHDASIPKPPGNAPIPTLARVACRMDETGEGTAAYSVVPTRRGDFAFGNLSARYKTALGLWHRQLRQEAGETVRVYPDTTEVRRYELRLRQGRLRDMGLHLLRLRGQGTEFESLREYTRDDEYKNINWKASARHGKLISTNYEIERDQTIVIALDCGRMMTALAEFGTRRIEASMTDRDEGLSTGQPVSGQPAVAVALSKLDCAINATVLLAHVAASMGDSVGLLLFADTVLGYVPPRKGRTQTGAIIEALYAAQPDLVEPDYIGAYEYLMARRLRRALVVTFTDLIDPEASRELLTASGALRRHHNALCITLNNRDVIDMADVTPQNSEELYQKAMAQRMLRHRFGALEALRQHGVGILDVEAAQLTIATVNRYLDLKSRAAL